ncbi:hypothetical protein FQR65_LT06995 [Abscondita terminalis]|nr:hypothetical protein FQR65_LT06995 [Abscondita terminalis]
MVRLRNPSSLEQAISFVLEEENYQRTNNFQNSSFSNSRYNQFHSNTPFPSQPIIIQPNQNIAPKRYFTNQQVFGKPRNSFQPNTLSQNMSTSTRNSEYPKPKSTLTRNTDFPKHQQLHNLEINELTNQYNSAVANVNFANSHPQQPHNLETNEFTNQYNNSIAGPSRTENSDKNQFELNSNENFYELIRDLIVIGDMGCKTGVDFFNCAVILYKVVLGTYEGVFYFFAIFRCPVGVLIEMYDKLCGRDNYYVFGIRNFKNKILKALNDLMQYIQLYIVDENLRNYKKFEYEKLALKTFQLGILEPYRSFLIHFELNNLEECLSKCKFYDNRKREEQYYDYIRDPIRKQFPKPNYSKPSNNVTSTTPNRYNNFQNTAPMNSNYHQVPPRIEPRPFQGSINKPIQQSPRVFTNKQVFGNPVSTTTSQNHSKPTRMSGISTFTTRKQPFQPNRTFSNHFRSTSAPNFVSQELHNIESLNDESQFSNSFNEEPTPNEFQSCDSSQENYYHEDENFQEPASLNQISR